MKSIIKRRKSNVQETKAAAAERPREDVAPMPRSRKRLDDNALRAPTPTRFSGAGWDEFLTNISAPQPPLTPLSGSPSTPNARLPGAGRDILSPRDDPYRAALAPAFGAPTTQSPTTEGSGFFGPGAGIGSAPRSPTGFTNAHMVPPSSPALTNALGSPIASPQHTDKAMYPAEARYSLGVTGQFVQAQDSTRSPLAPSSPLRSPLGGPPFLFGPDDSVGSNATNGAQSATSPGTAKSRYVKEPDQADAVSVKSSHSSSSKKGRSIGRFFRRNKANSNDWPDDNVPAMPTSTIFGAQGPSTIPGPAAAAAMRAQGAGPLSPPTSQISHPNGLPGMASFAFNDPPRPAPSVAAAQAQARVNGQHLPRGEQNEDNRVNGAKTSVFASHTPDTSGRRGEATPPQTDGSAKASIEQSNRSFPSVSSTSDAGQPALSKVTDVEKQIEQVPTSPIHLLPAPVPMLRKESSQSSLRQLLQDMNLSLGDESTPIVTLSNADEDKVERILEAGPKSHTRLAAALNDTGPETGASQEKDSTPPAPSSVEEDGTDSISAIQNMLGEFDMVTSFDNLGGALDLTQFGALEDPTASPQLITNTASKSALLTTPGLSERRGSALSSPSSAHSDAYGTPPEQPSTPVMPAAVAKDVESSNSRPSSTATPTYSRAASIASLRRPMNAPPIVVNGPAPAANGRPAQGPEAEDRSVLSEAGRTAPASAAASLPQVSPPSPRRVRVVLPAPKPRPEGAALADLMWTHTSVHFVQKLISLLDFNDIKSLRQTSRTFRSTLNSYPCKEIILRRFLGQVGYRSWARPKSIDPGQNPVPDPIPLSFSDAEGFLLSHHLMSEYSLVSQAYIRDPKGVDPRMLTLARATTRAYNRVLARLREQPMFVLPPQRKDTTDSTGRPANGANNYLDALPSPWKPGRAALFQVWVPCSNGSWLSDEELTRCEAELFKAGIWNNLKRGDVVWDCALGEEGNLGRLIYDGQFLRDLSFMFDPIGHLPSWLNILSFSPAHFHGRIRSSTGCPIVYIDMTPFREQIGATLHLVQDSAETVSPNGTRYRVQRWMYRAKVKVTPGTIISTYGLDCVHIDWAGTITIETDGTIEHARDLINRCFGPNSNPQARLQLLQAINKGPLPPLSGDDKWSYSDKNEATSPFEIVRANSKPGQLFIRPVIKAPQMI